MARATISPTRVDIVAGLALTMNVELTSATTFWELLKIKVYYSQVLEGTQHAWGHTTKLWEERKKKHTRGVLPLLESKVGVSRVNMSGN